MQKELLQIGVVVAVIVGFAAGFYVLAADRSQIGQIVDPDTRAVFDYCADSFSFNRFRFYGHFPDLATDSQKWQETSSTTRLWYAWFKDGESRPVTVESEVGSCPGVDISWWPDHVYYVFDYSENGDSWIRFHQDRLPNGIAAHSFNFPLGAGRAALGSYEVIVDGFEFCTVPIPSTGGCPDGKAKTIKDGAALRVTTQVERQAWPSWGPVNTLEDEIELRNALPAVWWDRASHKIGETAVVNWRVPITTDESGNPAYFLSVLDMNVNLPITGFDRAAITSTTGSRSFTVTQDLFSNALSTCQNRLRAEVLTQLIIAALQDSSVQAPLSIAGAEPPVVDDVSFDKPEYTEGDTIVLSWKASGNVTKFHVSLDIGGLVLFDEDVDASITEISVPAPRSGIAQAQVTAYSQCQPSGVKRAYATVGNAYPGLCTVYPDLPQCTSSDLIALVIAALAVLAVFATFIVVFWVLSKVNLLPGIANLIGALAAAGGLLLFFVTQGTFDVLLGV